MKLASTAVQAVAEVQEVQYWGHFLQWRMGVVAKKYPLGQEQEPSLLEVAETTHWLQVVAEEQRAQPEPQEVQTPWRS
jgi:streptomycin 6-kinase